MLLTLVIIYIASLIYLAITERFRHYTSLIALQGWLLFAIALARLEESSIANLAFVLVETLIFKAIIVPTMLYFIIRKTGINRIHNRSVTPFNQLLFSIVLLICSIIITYYMRDNRMNAIFFGVSLYALLSGMLLIITHKRIFSHLVGFLIIENGVFLFAMAIGIHMPYLINVAILLDILMSVLVLGLFIGKIGDKLHDMSVDKLSSIKD